MNDKLKALQEQKGRIVAEQRSLIDAAEGRSFNAEERSKFDQQDSDISDIDRKIKALEREEADKRSIAEVTEKQEAEKRGKHEDQNAETAHKQAFDAYLRHGLGELTESEKRSLGGFHKAIEGGETRAQNGGSGAAGGYLVPREFSNEIDVALKAYGGMLELGRTWGTGTGATVDWPTMDDTNVKGRILTSGTSAATGSTDLGFGSKTLTAFTYTSDLIAVDNALIQDSAFNLGALITEAMGIRFGRVQNEHYTKGTGSGQPQGVVVAAGEFTNGVSATGITADNLLELLHSVNRAYRKNAKYTLNDLTLAAVRKLKDAEGKYIWSMGDMQKGAPATIWGYQYEINDDLEDIGAEKKSVGFGDFKRYIIRTVAQPLIIRLNERFAENNQTAYVGFMRTDGRLLNSGAVKFLKHAAA
ncbi:phage major capsid protein, HK97 family [Fibrisoma limi BUZ 3]|uniref:Phage major capsid protein, HK97 family n=1 Tax=Fibrisoma limi BUZ 3 TaxID=1185876 RepID=I2GKQ2_9BACT|nr:phage major capsid protein [Fibrisoma limi]CCH54478.1 phage major capsid protein, HK97 family [Fibrisoma limi BUZ 3]